MNDTDHLPLHGVRVLDLAEGKVEMTGRLLADMGADVFRVEPREGAASRRREPVHAGVSLHFETHNANKRGLALDLSDDDDRATLLQLAADADIFIEAERPGTLAALGLGVEDLQEVNPRLVVVSISDFGQTGPYRDWIGTNWTHMAAAGVLSRSGIPGRAPVQPPGELAIEAAAVQATYAALIAYYHRIRTGVGEYVDSSVFESTIQVMDPPLGVGGSATGGLSMLNLGRGRPDMSHLYPIYECADGYVRALMLSKRQWQAMFRWLGSPEEFNDPKYDTVPARREAAPRLRQLITELFSDKSGQELIQRGVEYGIPIDVLSKPSQVLSDEHFVDRRSFTELEIAPGVVGKAAAGLIEFDGERAGIRTRAPRLGEHNGERFAPRPADWNTDLGGATALPTDRPLEGLRVLDLGVIIVGAETTRLLADQGAQVIKVENAAYPDGVRPPGSDLMNESYASGNRNKLGLGLNLRSPEGVEIFKQLAARSDVVVSNFKPHTMAKFGLSYEVLREINPGIVVIDSSALGNSGPASHRMGYGPLIRSTVGLTGLWQDTTVTDGFCDFLTMFPDHVAGRIGAIGIVASLIARTRTGLGREVSVAQAEVILTQLSTEYMRESLQPGSLVPLGNVGEFDAPQGIYACAGDDEWVSITVEGTTQFEALARTIGRAELADDPGLETSAGRIARRDEIVEAVSAWCATRTPREVTEALQAEGVPAGFMMRVTELLTDPHLQARGFLREMTHRHLPAPHWNENAPSVFRAIPDPRGEGAPLQGEDTRRVMAEVLGRSAEEIQSLLDAGILEEHPLVAAEQAALV